jgi:hypothetical protein
MDGRRRDKTGKGEVYRILKGVLCSLSPMSASLRYRLMKVSRFEQRNFYLSVDTRLQTD